MASRAKSLRENLFPNDEKAGNKFLEIRNGLTLLQNLQFFFIIQANICLSRTISSQHHLNQFYHPPGKTNLVLTLHPYLKHDTILPKLFHLKMSNTFIKCLFCYSFPFTATNIETRFPFVGSEIAFDCGSVLKFQYY